MADQHTDVLIVGAGLSAIDVAYRLQEHCPELDYTILEARDRIGGTWDLFTYPGVRSDSDIYTLGFPFRPWQGERSIVYGGELLQYLRDTASEADIDRHVRLRTRVVSADWSSVRARWIVDADHDGTPERYVARFVVFCTGYYDYERPHDPGFQDVEAFRGRVVHPQFWPADLDYAGKRVVVVGSGATAVTLVPALAADAAHVTMLQRTPSYVLAQPRTDAVARALRKVLPLPAAYRIARVKNTAIQWALIQACHRFPDGVRWLLHRRVASAVGSRKIADEHFSPPYAPWDQRLCIAPEGDLFRVIRDGTASVVTGRIERFVPQGILLASGRVVEADIVVTATGLRIKLLGGVTVTVDGESVNLAKSYTYHGAMLSGLPNLAVSIGYINLSWTVRVDMTARLITRLLRRMIDQHMDAVVPVVPVDIEPGQPFMDMASGYLARAAATMPRATSRYPWAVRQNVMVDGWATSRADLANGLRWTRVSEREEVRG
ncbi:Predicted flavoprotein CzcO associated with the cation diffusion facilitator CzcD [Parafrankia irregularis]|uniref:Predicted flavoprotein CzcO associated with the cation diffusion facilitator CzcD n=1 Tax=Parafrankia irregularis TaxID=795642 RepID=A0A0S4QVS2_9ACTN|nr:MULTISPECIES: NAD(P)/FAD-dependent oxidoreductase [Parafrankia]MBE3200321.1 NAD(P)/FAD-dependent oxidoreductase [Parafrankia sp. CH37]CUU59728.1 Predicted flavoprotein CzcO associated with the cation diffusion facilitator CzcD [Parafrankia irregularis]